jgi:hypothetical protein
VRLGLALLTLLVPILGSGCGDDDGDSPSSATIIEVPFDVATLEEAIAMATPNDTIRITDSFLPALTAPLQIRSDQTPLVITGFKTLPTLVAPPGQPAIRLQNPQGETALRFLRFSGGNPAALEISGGGDRVLIEDCEFTGGEIHVLASGRDLDVEVHRCLMEAPALFGIDMRSASRLRAERNTIVGAGDCAIRIDGGSRGTVLANVLSGAANYGIACTSGGALRDDSGCNCIHASGVSPYLGCEGPTTDFELDPRFCDAANGDYEVDELSPTTPLNSGADCGQVGAFGVGCSPPEEEF